MTFEPRFRSLLVAALLAVVPGGLAGALWPPLGTVVFAVALVVLVPPTDGSTVRRIVRPAVDQRGDVVRFKPEGRGAPHAVDDHLAAVPGPGEDGLTEPLGHGPSPAPGGLTARALGLVRRAAAPPP